MKAETLLKNSLSKKQIYIIIMSVTIPILVGGMIYGFIYLQKTTRASEEAPLNVLGQSSEAKSATISWETAKDTIATVEYGITPDPSGFTFTAISQNPSTSHTVSLSSLQPGTTYYYQIRIGDTVYDNGGALWSFTTPPSTEISTTPEASPSASLSPTTTASIVPTPTKTATLSGTLTPSATPSATITATISATISASTSASICNTTDCTSVLRNLGSQCSTADYIKCLFNVKGSQTPTPSGSATPTPVSSSVKSSCSVGYLQSNSCTSIIWEDIMKKESSCTTAFTKYFVQCKSNSFSSNDSATWFCNKTFSTNQVTLPCDTAPTPFPGQSMFCRVRAETTSGGDSNATDWIYTNTSCSSYGSLTGVSNCQLNYLQQNTCGKWSWSLNNPNDSQCTSALDHYFLQCTNNGIFSAPGATTPTPLWYCNNTTKNRNLSMPCDIAITPADGSTLTCRVRPEDAKGTDDHAGSWMTTTATCPTSTPTPTNTPTATNTPTSTRTPTPIP